VSNSSGDGTSGRIPRLKWVEVVPRAYNWLRRDASAGRRGQGL